MLAAKRTRHGAGGEPIVEPGAEARPLAEVFNCSTASEALLCGGGEARPFVSGETIFRQGERGRALYVVVSGCLTRRAARNGVRVDLGRVRQGELVELAASLGDGVHTYTLTAETDGILLLLPPAALEQALERDAGLRMRLLEELAREVSRAYTACRRLLSEVRRSRGHGPEA